MKESGKEGVYSCCVLHGGRGGQRMEALEAFKSGAVRFIICTDVAARGIDVKELPFVVCWEKGREGRSREWIGRKRRS